MRQTKNAILKNLRKHHLILFVLLVLGLFLRVYNFQEWFMYNHDNDLASWFVKDVVVDKHLRLIGQLTSQPGIFIGPLFYYLLIPFYSLFNMDPVGGVFLTVGLGLFSIASIYWIMSRVFGQRAGLIAAFIHTISYALVFNDRWVVPTMPVILWTIWYFYALHLLTKNDIKGYLLAGLLAGLIWNLNLALMLLFPLIPLAVLLAGKKIKLKNAAILVLTFLLAAVPLLAFEVKHGFIQSQAFISSLTQKQGDVLSGIEKVEKVFRSADINAHLLIFANTVQLQRGLSLVLVLSLFVWLAVKKRISAKHKWIMLAWIGLYLGFFSFYSKPLSEYYLDGLALMWIVVMTLVLDYLLGKKTAARYLGITIMTSYLFLNLASFFAHQTRGDGYLQRKEIASFINQDRIQNGYDCVSVSYITDPGYNLGYRYFFWLEDIKTKKPGEGAPVYSIVFPHSKVDRIDKAFGTLGLILPEYDQYSQQEVGQSCEGDNLNISESMFGFTQ